MEHWIQNYLIKLVYSTIETVTTGFESQSVLYADIGLKLNTLMTGWRERSGR